MNHLLHQFRKDWAEFRWWLLGLWVLCVSYCIAQWHMMPQLLPGIFAFSLGNPPFLSRWWCAVELIPMSCGAILSARVLLADHAIADSAFWRTRPISRLELAAGKIGILLGCIVAPLSLIAIVNPLWFCMPLGEIFSIWMWRFLGLGAYGWFIFWVVGFTRRLPVCVSIIAGLVLVFQFGLWPKLNYLPDLIISQVEQGLASIGYSRWVARLTQEQRVTLCLSVQTIGILSVALWHYKSACRWRSIACASILAILSQAFGRNFYATPMHTTVQSLALRELAREPVTTEPVVRRQGYAWTRFDLHHKGEVRETLLIHEYLRSYSGSRPWEAGLIAALKFPVGSHNLLGKSQSYVATLWDREQKSYPNNPSAGCGGSPQFFQFWGGDGEYFKTVKNPGNPINWENIELVIYEPDKLGATKTRADIAIDLATKNLLTELK
jgi:hypothetical protein